MRKTVVRKSAQRRKMLPRQRQLADKVRQSILAAGVVDPAALKKEFRVSGSTISRALHKLRAQNFVRKEGQHWELIGAPKQMRKQRTTKPVTLAEKRKLLADLWAEAKGRKRKILDGIRMDIEDAELGRAMRDVFKKF